MVARFTWTARKGLGGPEVNGEQTDALLSVTDFACLQQRSSALDFHSSLTQFPPLLFDMTMTTTTKIHPLVRDLYKRALMVGRDYPQGLDYVREKWKTALRDPNNCPSWYSSSSSSISNTTCSNVETEALKEREMRRAVAKGRFMIREMVGVIQLKKYRTMKRRYASDDRYEDTAVPVLQRAMENLEEEKVP
ncbi:flavoprotein regulatory factor 1 [Seminavis robusta]|uniref:Flavoprotein regulatory factor 1 n=1 Tax=Seminavis robusta TaxID=568900 RepID=A0A9N8HMJ1_9STRA|nr:flavoprotein regulatory factor 1 [Seminavis robusta]|eukprot:Sro909_g219020.1 flavoprotein regulatory factor 1 (192) ;mRNA; r:29766-30341